VLIEEHIHTEVMAATDGRGVELVFETVGGEMFANTLRTLTFDGKMIVIGASPAARSEREDQQAALPRSVGDRRPFGHPVRPPIRQDGRWRRLVHELYLQGKVKPNIMQVLPFERLAEAFALITGREVRGKVILKVG
jgi:NADPH2:quinone reductase